MTRAAGMPAVFATVRAMTAWTLRSGVVRCSNADTNGTLTFVLENPGPYRGPREGSEGLPSLRKQLELTWGRAASLVVEAVGNERTRATLKMPTTQSENRS
jgi:hypothetical protein